DPPGLGSRADALRGGAGLTSALARVPARSWGAMASPRAGYRQAGFASAVSRQEIRLPRRASFYARRYGIGRRLSEQIYDAATAERLSPSLAFSLVQAESGFDATAVGPSGSVGLTQLQPSTARQLSPSTSARDLFSPRVNLTLGFRYLRMQLDRFDDVALALAAYNRGPDRVRSLVAQGRAPSTAYARRILRDIERSSGPAL
ncbi:MAG: transglycosylase SLT domain-containing protein, partial [Gemmatimonadetes bacterium]|nr:transglycosylase SLT domain-containing protein [Gemmatimonadota bacterium]